MDLELSGKIALVTGSSRGIGNAIAKRLSQEDMAVVLNGQNVENLKRATANIRGSSYLAGDMTDASETSRIVETVEEQHGRLDVLICNVGSGASVPPGTETPDEWERMFKLNLFSATHLVSAATPMLGRTQGTVVCLSSICGLEELGCPIAYASAKAALNSFVRGIARPLAKQGIRINAVAPGNILFPGSVWERKLAENPEAVEAMLRRDVALGRLGNANEVADFVAFLASPRAGFVTGGIFVVDGGQKRS